MTESSMTIGPKLLELLGVPINRCRKVTIKIEVNTPVFVEAEFYASEELSADIREIETEIKEYKLVEIENQQSDE